MVRGHLAWSRFELLRSEVGPQDGCTSSLNQLHGTVRVPQIADVLSNSRQKFECLSEETLDRIWKLVGCCHWNVFATIPSGPKKRWDFC